MQLIFLGILIARVIVYVYEKNYKRIRNFVLKRTIKKEENEFYRDVEINYSPSIVSYLYNQIIEPQKDLTADILNLYARDIIKISKEKDGDIIELNHKIYNQKKIYSNDEYLINTIILKKEKFEYEIWQKEIKDVYRNVILKQKHDEKRKKEKSASFYLWLFVWGPLLVSFSGMIIAAIVGVRPDAVLASLTAIELCYVYFVYTMMLKLPRDEVKDMYLNTEAKEELKRWFKFEKFLKEYTLMNEREYKDIVIYKKYIPFAMTLDINKNYIGVLKEVMNVDDMERVLNSIDKYNNENYCSIWGEL